MRLHLLTWMAWLCPLSEPYACLRCLCPQQIKPKRRRVTSDMDDALELAVHSATSGMEDPLVDTYLDICFDDSVTEDASTVLSLDHDVREWVLKILVCLSIHYSYRSPQHVLVLTTH